MPARSQIVREKWKIKTLSPKHFFDPQMLLFLTLFVAILAADEKIVEDAVKEESKALTGHALAEYMRTHQSLFEVEESEEVNDRMKYLLPKHFMVKPKEEDRTKIQLDKEPPEKFDARDAWPYCREIIGHVRDQSRCGSCWAVSAASTMSDRLCVQSNGKIKLHVSDTDILACCGEFCGAGCSGGWPFQAWKWVGKYGVCTGGDYRAKGVCKPYSFHPCGNHKNQVYYGECPKGSWPTPRCEQFCRRGYTKPYKKDKFYAKKSYWLPNDEKEIRLDIMKNGPVQAAFDVYEDFKLYKRGIYKHKEGIQTGGHAVKIIGWGKENGTDYWLIANSWSKDWGESGFFRMVRGENDCEIEDMITAGIMIV
ncbi:hypothetical protein RB195_007666 [Necator americanus]|uniref:Peptidase C1A papain C-terminal domain-containing protein n=2 Tax=Necator americanus TaxID=51031 RepID=A0ABR1BYB6_NECAM